MTSYQHYYDTIFYGRLQLYIVSNQEWFLLADLSTHFQFRISLVSVTALPLAAINW